MKLGADVWCDEIFQKPLWLTSLTFSFRVSGRGSHFLPFEHQKSSLPALVNCSAKWIWPWTLLQSFQFMHISLPSRYWTERSLAREFGQNWCLHFNLTPFFKYSTYLHTYTLVAQSSKSVEKNLAYFKIYWIFGTNTSCPPKAMQNGILSIILLHEKICNLIGLEQWYFSLIWKSYMWKLQTFCG